MGFYQPRAVELGLCSDDLLVLRWFVDYAGTDKMRTLIIDNSIYYWVNYDTVLKELPILKVKKQTLYKKHFMNLCNANVLIHKQVKEGGNFSYYCYGINYQTLLYLQDKDTPLVKNTDLVYKHTEGVYKDTEPCVQTYQTLAYKHTEQILDHNNIIPQNNKRENVGQNPTAVQNPLISNIFEYWNSKDIIKHQQLTDETKKAIEKALKTYKEEEIKEYIDRYNKVLKDKDWYFDTKWTLAEFLKQKNGISNFTDEGSKWINYLKHYEKSTPNCKPQQNDDYVNVDISYIGKYGETVFDVYPRKKGQTEWTEEDKERILKEKGGKRWIF